MTEPPATKPDRPWLIQPGQTRNPGGRPKEPKDLQDARRLNQYEFERTVNKMLALSVTDLKEALQKPEITVLDKMIGTIMEKAALRGDVKRAEWIMSRMLGKVKERVEISSTSQSSRVSVNINARAEAMSLEDPNLTMAQLEAFQEKIGKIKEELGGQKLVLPPAGETTLEAELIESERVEAELEASEAAAGEPEPEF